MNVAELIAALAERDPEATVCIDQFELGPVEFDGDIRFIANGRFGDATYPRNFSHVGPYVVLAGRR